VTAHARQAVLLARASTARRLVREGLLTGWDALYYTVFPTPAIRRAEHKLTTGQVVGRAYHPKQNT